MLFRSVPEGSGFRGDLGGPQEGGRHAGTENLPGIAGMVAALLARERDMTGTASRGTALRDAASFIQFSDFTNQSDYAGAANALNEYALRTVVAPLPLDAVSGRAISFVGAISTSALRDDGAIEVAPRLTLCISPDGDLARRSVKRYVAHYVNLIRPPELNLEPTWLARVAAALDRSRGWYFDVDRIDDPEIDRLVDDDLVRRFAIAGTPAECANLASEALGLGFSAASFNLAAPLGGTLAEGLQVTLEGAAEVLAALRAGRAES